MAAENEDLLQIHVGDAADGNVLSALIKDCDVIINACSSRGNDRPISTVISDIIMKCLSGNKTIRYFVITGKTVKSGKDSFSLTTMLQRKYLKKLYPAIVRNKQDEHDMLYSSSINWTLVRCPLLVDGESTACSASEKRCSGKALTKKGLAAFILSEIKNGDFQNKSPFVFSKGKIE